MRVKIGLIGGTGFYELLSGIEELEVETPYGNPSDKLFMGVMGNKKIVFIPRHGRKHSIPPHMINHKANIYAMKTLGVKFIISTASVGVINEGIKLKDFIIPHDFLDFTRKVYTFYDEFKENPFHVELTHPFSEKLRRLLIDVCKEGSYSCHERGVYVNVAGPRLETPAEIRMFKKLGGDIIGMTVVPEAILSKEVGIEYACLAIGVNYACGLTEKPINLEEASKILEEVKPNVYDIFQELVKRLE